MPACWRIPSISFLISFKFRQFLFVSSTFVRGERCTFYTSTGITARAVVKEKAVSQYVDVLLALETSIASYHITKWNMFFERSFIANLFYLESVSCTLKTLFWKAFNILYLTYGVTASSFWTRPVFDYSGILHATFAITLVPESLNITTIFPYNIDQRTHLRLRRDVFASLSMILPRRSLPSETADILTRWGLETSNLLCFPKNLDIFISLHY